MAVWLKTWEEERKYTGLQYYQLNIYFGVLFSINDWHRQITQLIQTKWPSWPWNFFKSPPTHSSLSFFRYLKSNFQINLLFSSSSLPLSALSLTPTLHSTCNYKLPFPQNWPVPTTTNLDRYCLVSPLKNRRFQQNWPLSHQKTPKLFSF